MKNPEPKVAAIIRSFQGGKDFANFDKERCEEGVVKPIRKLTQTKPPELRKIIVVTCGEEGSKYAEEVVGDSTPTLEHLRNTFPEEIASGFLQLHICKD